MITILLSQLKVVSQNRPAGYYEDVLSHGEVNGGVLVLDRRVYSRLREKYSSTSVSAPPLPKKVGNAMRALGRVGTAIVKQEKVLVPQEEQARRLTICQGCEFFNGTSCQKCGCVARFKTKLATEACPVGKW